MFRFTTNEIRDLIVSFLIISLGFSILYSNRNLNAILTIFPMVLVGVGLGFVVHEIAHKLASLHYDFWAEYKLWVPGLLIALISSFFGFIFAAPGAVHIYGNNMTKKENGVISLVGPLSNIILSIIFLILYLNSMVFIEFGLTTFYLLQSIFYLGFSINGFLALFNLIPFGIFDGAKVIRWNGIIWIGAVIVSGILVSLPYIGIGFL